MIARSAGGALRVRPLGVDDIPAASEAGAAAFGVDLSEPAAALGWRDRIGHSLRTDPEGGFVAERGGRVIGVAQAIVRERLWCLSLLAVHPGVQSGGAGRALVARALRYGDDWDSALIVASNDPRALRLYRLAGFSLRPALQAQGVVDRRALPRPDPGVSVLDGRDALAAEDAARQAPLGTLESISREIRGGPHTPELEFVLGQGARLLRLGDRGFAVVRPGHGPWMLVARDERTATTLLWHGLALAGETERVSVRWITAGHDWALDVVLRAGLSLSAYGALCVRGDPGPLRPFIPSPPFA